MSTPFRHGPLHVTELGAPDRDTVVILHGWGSRGALMAPLARALADDRRILLVDLPGHGAAPNPTEPMGLPEHAEAVADLVRDRVGEPVTIFGHSNGGRIALYMASDPDLAAVVRNLVLVSPSGVRRPRTPLFYLRRALSLILRAPFRILPASLSVAGLDWLRHSLVWKALGSSDYRRLEGVMRETFVLLVNHYLEDRLDSIRVPVLVFRGDRDEDIVASQVQRIVDLVPDSGLGDLPGAGHYGFLDRPDIVVAGVRHFLAAAS